MNKMKKKKLNTTIIIVLTVLLFISSAITVGIGKGNQEEENNKNMLQQSICQSIDENSVYIDGDIKCRTKPFIYGHEELFSVTLVNDGNQDVNAIVKFYIWDYGDVEWDFLDQSKCSVPSNGMNSDPDDVDHIWSVRFWEILVPGYMKAELYVDDELVDTQENRFFLWFFIV
jgi:hypothetical protein